MKKELSGLMVAMVLGGAVVAGTLTSCDDDDNNAVTGVGGTGGTGTGTGGTGGTGGAANTTTFNMTLTGGQEVPVNTSPATGNVTVSLNRSTGAVTVTGQFDNLSSNATVAHIHGPAAVGEVAPPLITLTVPASQSGMITGTATMSDVQMTDMLGGMTYVNLHSSTYPDGEIRAQIVP